MMTRRPRSPRPSLGRVTSRDIVTWPATPPLAPLLGSALMAEPPPPDHRELHIPLGGLSRHAVRRPPLRRMLLLRWPLLVALAGAGAALAGVLLATAEPQVEVGLDAAGYRIDGERLADRGGGVYQGADGAALVIDRRATGRVAGASADMDGRHM